MKVLITRPREQSERLAKRISRLGHEPILAPMLRILPHSGSVTLPVDSAALLFTSAHGVQVFASSHPERSTPAYTVGDATAAAARAAGFRIVESAGGNANSLLCLIRDRVPAQSGTLIHVRGRDVAADVAEALRQSGYCVHERIIYSAAPARCLPAAAVRAIRSGRLGAALFFSARSAGTFADMLSSEDRAALCSARAIAISQGVAAALASIGFCVVETAVVPSEDAMIACLQESDSVGMPC